MAAAAPSTSTTATSSTLNDFERQSVITLVHNALLEDLSPARRDITTLATVPPHVQSTAIFIAKDVGVLSGLAVAELIFHTIDPTINVQWYDNIYDGCYIGQKGTPFGRVTGSAHSLLLAERTVLNTMQRMSGIATATRAYVNEMQRVGSRTRVLDTRKTAPGLRIIDKLAVKHGGGVNHRMGLYDMFMMKDNHITASGGVENALQNCYQWLQQQQQQQHSTPSTVIATDAQHTPPIDYSAAQIEIETRTLDEIKEVLRVTQQHPHIPLHRIMLDNMVSVRYKDGNSKNHSIDNVDVDTTRLREAVQYINGRYETEASGNVNLGTIGRIAQANPTFVSVGALTHSVNAFDISLKMLEKDGQLHTAHLNVYDVTKPVNAATSINACMSTTATSDAASVV